MTKTDAIVIRGLSDEQLQATQKQLNAQGAAASKYKELQQQLQSQQLIHETISAAITSELDSIARGVGLDPDSYTLSIGAGGLVLAEKKPEADTASDAGQS
jgi:hypothetical protein